MVTRGDRVLDKPLASIGGKGLFNGEVEATLLDNRADLAVHSMKDVPDELADGMAIVCIPEREDPRDAVVSRDGRGLDSLDSGAVVGTSSLRRSCQLHAARPDLHFKVIRGNVGTRLEKLKRGEFDAVVLAMAGIRRLGLEDACKPVALDKDICIPAVGQGALGIEAPADSSGRMELLGKLENAETRLIVEAERAFLKRLQGACTTPIAAHGSLSAGHRLELIGMVGSLDGDTVLNATVDGYIDAPDRAARLQAAHRMGQELASALLDQGAGPLLEKTRSADDPYEHGLYGANGHGRQWP